MKLNKNEQNYLLTILFKSYILQSVICSGIILVCTVSLDMGLTWVLDRYVEHYYLIYRGLYVYMVGLILWVVCIMYLTYKLLKKVVNYVYELQTATGKLFDKSVDYIELSPELSEIAININRLKQEAENNARLAQENEQRKNDLIMYLAHDLKTPLSSVIGYLTLLHDDEQQISQELREKYLSITLDKAERLEDLINEFFEITRFNLSNITLQYSNINLTRLLEQLIYEFKPILKEKNLKCTLNSTSDIMLHCDANKIQRVFDNLLRNAVIYSYTDTEVAITTELQEKENDYPSNLSGGEQQRVAIARALAVSPEAILCDEPTGALDKKTGKQIMDLLHQVVLKNGIMLLIVTHDLDIAKTCNTIFEMDGGRLQCVKYDS